MQIESNQKPKQKNRKKHKRKRKDTTNEPNPEITSDAADNSAEHSPPKPKKRNKQFKQPDEFQVSKQETKNEEGTAVTTNTSKEESNRQKKKKKHELLMAEKKVQSEKQSQEKALNYLSQWKHNRSEWKFEKLRQVWLQQNLFDENCMPDKYWQTALEYFVNSKGHSRHTLIKEAMKIIESAEEKEEKKNDDDSVEKADDEDDDADSEESVKLNRAREILQHLQE